MIQHAILKAAALLALLTSLTTGVTGSASAEAAGGAAPGCAASGCCEKAACGAGRRSRAANKRKAAACEAVNPLTVSEVVVGPFDIRRKYRSMEGPYVVQKLKVGDLAASGRVDAPETAVLYVEGGGPAASMGVAASAGKTQRPDGLVDTSNQKRELWWFKGIKIEVLDEQGRKLPTAEFICHLNVDLDSAFRKQVFPSATHSGNGRLMTLTQGQTEFNFPSGFAVPVASDEVLTITFQAANRTTTRHRRLKHICTLTLARDADLKEPIQALHWYNPFVVVAVDKDSLEAREVEHRMTPDCLGISGGENAPNMVAGSNFKDSTGRRLSGHWLVPPGVHTYRTPIVNERDRGFADRERSVHAVFTHVHPTCTESSLVVCDGQERKKVFTAKIKTRVRGGLELVHIENIISGEGIMLPAGQHYELEATYKNPTNTDLDSMVALGIFAADPDFKRPTWPDKPVAELAACKTGKDSAGEDSLYCGIRPVKESSVRESAAKESPAGETIRYKDGQALPGYPLFSVADDGPLIDEDKEIEITTTAGPLRLRLEPSLAPQHATQLYRLLRKGVFDGTEIFRYEPGFVLQVANAERKVLGQPALSGSQLDMLRRLPLELPGAHYPSPHKQWALSMARYDDKSSAVSSFSILLADSPHLDGSYTVFGHLVPDEATMATIRKIQEGWLRAHPSIVRAGEPGKLVSSKQGQGK